MDIRYFGAISRDGNGLDGLVKIENGTAYYYDKVYRHWAEENTCFYALIANLSFREISKAEADNLIVKLNAN